MTAFRWVGASGGLVDQEPGAVHYYYYKLRLRLAETERAEDREVGGPRGLRVERAGTGLGAGRWVGRYAAKCWARDSVAWWSGCWRLQQQRRTVS